MPKSKDTRPIPPCWEVLHPDGKSVSYVRAASWFEARHRASTLLACDPSALDPRRSDEPAKARP